ncbi:MAG: hypothetical protein R3E86_08975 [Pseudomonadales bacterium]
MTISRLACCFRQPKPTNRSPTTRDIRRPPATGLRLESLGTLELGRLALSWPRLLRERRGADQRYAIPLRVPVTAIYSKRDRVVVWLAPYWHLPATESC